LNALFFLLVLPGEDATFYGSLVYLLQKIDENLFSIIFAAVLVDIALAFLFTLLLALFLSHKVGGPVFKLERNVERLKGGDMNIQAMSLREGDQGQILAVKFNGMVKNWCSIFREFKFYHGKFSARASALQKEWERGDACDAATIARIKDDAEKMQAVLDRFTV
jgi:hypothetical protein